MPKEWIHKIVRKIKASNELYHKALGTIDTPEKFEDKRLELAMTEWERMKATDTCECRNCHNFAQMVLDKQDERSADQHDLHVWEILDGKIPPKPVLTAIRV